MVLTVWGLSGLVRLHSGAGGGGAVVAASPLHFPHEGVDQAPFILYFPFTTALSVILLDLL
jgi:hypothetical protein